MIKIYIQQLLVLGVFVDLYFNLCPDPMRVKILGSRRKQVILSPYIYDLDWSFGMIASLNTKTDKNCDCQTRSENKTINISGSRNCSLKELSRKKVVDSCPYHYQLNYDRFRIPQYIIQVKCNCDNCIGRKPDGSLQELHDGRCTEVMIPRKVLRLCSKKRRKVYTVRIEEYAVACTCQWPNPNQV